MSGSTKEIRRLITIAKRQRDSEGRRLFKVTRKSDGNLTVENKITGARYTPSLSANERRAFIKAKVGLRSIGVTIPGRPPKPLHRNKTSEDTLMPQPIPTPHSPSVQARVEAIINDPDSMQRVAESIRERARAINVETGQPEGRQHSRHGRLGYQWRGDLYPAIHAVWPDLPRNPAQADVVHLQAEMIKALRDSGQLDIIGKSGGMASWWVSQEPSEPPPAGQAEEAGEVTEPEASTPPEPADDPARRQPQPESSTPMKLFQCSHKTGAGDPCAYVGDSAASVRTHIDRLGDVPHPAGSFPCNVSNCPQVLVTLEGYKQHMRNRHKMAGYMCHEDLSWWPTRAGHDAHVRSLNGHGPTNGVAAVATAPPEVPEAAAEVSVVAAPALLNGAADDLDVMATKMAEVLADYRRMKAGWGSMEQRLTDLGTENAELRRKLGKITRALQ